MNNSQQNPEAYYQRGQNVKVRSVLNNHRGGFTRLALVPVEAMWNERAHDRLATHYSCWGSTRVPCGGGFYNCGTARNQQAGETTFTIPPCLPDGSYVLSYAWFGGLTTKKGIPDYHHCAHVRIAGGNPASGTCQPQFLSNRDSCTASARKVGDCKVTGCASGVVFQARPAGFEGGVRPTAYSVGDVLRVRNDPTGSYDSWPSVPATTPVSPPSQPTPTNRPRDTASPVPSTFIPAGRRPTKCGGGVCCSSTCTQCAGIDCHKSKTLDSDLCCRNSVTRTKRYCENHDPPCICRRGPKDCPKYY